MTRAMLLTGWSPETMCLFLDISRPTFTRYMKGAPPDGVRASLLEVLAETKHADRVRDVLSVNGRTAALRELFRG